MLRIEIVVDSYHLKWIN